MFRNKSDHKKYGFVLVLYLFRDISSFKSEKGNNIKLSRKGFLSKKDINTCTTKLQEILKHNARFVSVLVFISKRS